MTETKLSAFDERQRPSILFEPAKFHFYSDHQFERSHPNLRLATNESGKPFYGLPSIQWKRLEEAYSLDAQAAILGTSWGRFQLMGFNFREAGFALLESFLIAMCASEKTQLDASVAFIKYDKHRLEGLRTRNWATFARYYNGPKFGNYDIRMKNNYDDLGK